MAGSSILQALLISAQLRAEFLPAGGKYLIHAGVDLRIRHGPVCGAEGEGEGDALPVGAELYTAVDIEYIHPFELSPGVLADGIRYGPYVYALIHDERKVACYGGELGQGLEPDSCTAHARECFDIDLGDIEPFQRNPDGSHPAGLP